MGGLIGVPPSHAAEDGLTTGAQRSSRTSRAFVAFGALTAAALAIVFFLWGIGAVCGLASHRTIHDFRNVGNCRPRRVFGSLREHPRPIGCVRG